MISGTFDSAKEWYSKTLEEIGPVPVIVICGNKSDLEPTIDTTNIETWATANGCNFIKTSALSGSNISNMFDSNDYNRSVYNVYINSVSNTKNTNNRIFTTFDYYPTTLASLGFDIDGNRLGLGTNLFSKRETLAEELGLDELNDELSKNSKYYNNRLLGDSYEELKKAVSSE